MNKKRTNNVGFNTNVSVDPSASANASPNITNHIYIRDFKRTDDKPMTFNASAVSQNSILTRDIQLEDDTEEKVENTEEKVENNTEKVEQNEKPKKQKIYAREVVIKTEAKQPENTVTTIPKTAEQLILETYAKILLDQNKHLLLNLISKSTIIVPKSSLEQIISAKVGYRCQISLHDDETGCCIAKYSPIKKIETIKIINNDLVSDFKNGYNNDYNDLINLYYLNLKFAIEG